MNYNAYEVVAGNRTYVFVTRGKSKPFGADEAVTYINNKEFVEANPQTKILIETKDEPETPKEWRVGDSKDARNIFLADLKTGEKFCCVKYGVKTSQIVEEAKRLGVKLSWGFIAGGITCPAK